MLQDLFTVIVNQKKLCLNKNISFTLNMRPSSIPTKKHTFKSKPKKSIKARPRPKVSLRKGFKVRPKYQKIIITHGQSGSEGED